MHLASRCLKAGLQQAHLLRRVAGSLQSVCQSQGVAEDGAPLRVHIEPGAPLSSLPPFCCCLTCLFLLPASCCQLLAATKPQLPQLNDLQTEVRVETRTGWEAGASLRNHKLHNRI